MMRRNLLFEKMQRVGRFLASLPDVLVRLNGTDLAWIGYYRFHFPVGNRSLFNITADAGNAIAGLSFRKGTNPEPKTVCFCQSINTHNVLNQSYLKNLHKDIMGYD